MTSIAHLLGQRLEKTKNSAEVGLQRYAQSLKVDVLQKIDKNYAYVTDGVHTIMAIHGKRREEINCYPLNRLCNPFYTFDKKIHLYLNFKQQTEPPEKSDIHPYDPHYYFKDDYNDFLQYRKVYKIPKPMERLVMSDWSFGLVNINCTGYYAPVIVYQKFQKQSNFNQIPKYIDLRCILFEPHFQNILQKFRLQDIRRLQISKFPATVTTSLFYFLRYQRKTTNKLSNILAIDHSSNLLKYSKQQQHSYVLIGQSKGPCSLINPLKKNINYKHIEDINIQQLALVFKNMTIQSLPKQKKSQNLIENEQSHKNQLDFDSQSEQDDDPLRNIYTKKLMQMNKQKLKPESGQI